MRAPTVGALGEAKRGEKAQFTSVNEHFEPIFNAVIAESGLVQRSRIINIDAIKKLQYYSVLEP
ncbi:MAG: hypothetical protein COB62_03265 [Piscirickettsiaceae bacterium]|nr:MAG: hypothetical protein COB62_03265 [Piscirickettsiaceae bacterium]